MSPLVKRVLNIALAIKMLKLDLYVHFYPKWAHIEETLMKLNIYNFFHIRWWIIKKI